MGTNICIHYTVQGQTHPVKFCDNCKMNEFEVLVLITSILITRNPKTTAVAANMNRNEIESPLNITVQSYTWGGG